MGKPSYLSGDVRCDIEFAGAKNIWCHIVSNILTFAKVARFILIFSTNSSSDDTVDTDDTVLYKFVFCFHDFCFHFVLCAVICFLAHPGVAAKLITMLLFSIVISSVRSFWNNSSSSVSLSSIPFLFLSFKNFWYRIRLFIWTEETNFCSNK